MKSQACIRNNVDTALQMSKMVVHVIEADYSRRARIFGSLHSKLGSVKIYENEDEFNSYFQDSGNDLILIEYTSEALSNGLYRVLGDVARLPIVVYGDAPTVKEIVSCMRKGASGFIEYPFDENLVDELLAAAANKAVYKKAVGRYQAVNSTLAILSRRQIEIEKLYASGLTIKEIGHRLRISHRTVEAHRRGSATKLGISGREVVSLFIELGLLENYFINDLPLT